MKYRGTRDGFSTGSFNTNCGGVANTLIIIKSASGNIFGGFTERAWVSSNQWIVDPKAYIFSIVNKDNKPFKADSNNNGAIASSSDYGPGFGDTFNHKFEIYIGSDSNTNQTSYCDFGGAFKHTDYQFGTEKAKAILAGSYHFKTVEIEVFSASN